MTHQQELQPSWVRKLLVSRPFERSHSTFLPLLFKRAGWADDFVIIANSSRLIRLQQFWTYREC